MFIFSKKNDKIAKSFYDHNEKVDECFENLEKFFEILFSENPDRHKLESAKVAVDHCEANADKELRNAVFAMSEAYLPVTRKNLIALVQSTDEVANQCQDIARQIYLEKVQLPKVLHEDIMKVLAITQKQLEILYSAIDKLLNDFKGISKNRKILDDVRTEESHVDEIEEMLHTRIFELDIPLGEKVYYRDIVESICQISDIIEDISDQIQVMLIEREA